MTCVVAAGNMMLFDKDGKIKRYDSPEQILEEFFDLRLEYYEKRRVSLLQVPCKQPCIPENCSHDYN